MYRQRTWKTYNITFLDDEFFERDLEELIGLAFVEHVMKARQALNFDKPKEG